MQQIDQRQSGKTQAMLDEIIERVKQDIHIHKKPSCFSLCNPSEDWLNRVKAELKKHNFSNYEFTHREYQGFKTVEVTVYLNY